MVMIQNPKIFLGDLAVSELSKTITYINEKGKYEEKILLDKVSFYLPGGSLLALLGRSGSGKSVFLRSLLNLFPPRKGKVFFYPFQENHHSLKTNPDTNCISESENQDSFQDLKTLYDMSGIVFQGYGLFDQLTVGENILFPLLLKMLKKHPWQSFLFGKNWPLKNLEHLGKKLLQSVGLSENLFYDTISSLSGGMKRRVAIARALSKKPKYLFFDEPTEGLDPITSKDITHLIKNIHHGEKTTTIIITHDPQQALYLADYIGLMDKGRLVFFNKKELLDKEAPYFVKEFLSIRY